MKTAFITGAGSGIGRAIAIALGNSGYALALVGRRRAALEETAELTGAPETLILTGDLSSAGEASGVVTAAEQGLGEGGIGVLVNNAGRGVVAPLSSLTPGVWDEMLAVNASSAAYCTMAAWGGMVKRGGGVIVNIASMAVYDPFEGFFAYGAAKAAMALMTVSAAKEGEAAGITAYCLCPGAVETPLLRSAFDKSAIPPSATLTPEEVAAVALSCVRGEKTASNGRVIPVLPKAMESWWSGRIATNPNGWLGEKPCWGH